MVWEQKATIACRERGLEVMPYGFEYGWVFVKDNNGKVFPIGEDMISKWIKITE